jgi:hypothetical protein
MTTVRLALAALLAASGDNSAFAQEYGSDLCSRQLRHEWLSHCAASMLPSVGLGICVSYRLAEYVSEPVRHVPSGAKPLLQDSMIIRTYP